MNNKSETVKWQWPRNFFCGLRANIALSGLSLILALWMTSALNLLPCHLCMIQRALYVMIIMISLCGFLFRRSRTKPTIAYSINLLVALCGLGIALRQSYLQWYPSPEPAACLPDFSTLLNFFTPLEALMETLKGSGNCAQIDWTFLGLSIAQYSAILFLFLVTINFYFLFIKKTTCKI
jgi:disulfide bond formation protein DsbB